MSNLTKQANEISERFFNDKEDDVFKPLAKKVADMAYDALNDNIARWLIDDSEANLSIKIKEVVEREIESILMGVDEGLRYISSERAVWVRKAVFNRYGDLLRNKRIEDLEAELERCYRREL